MWLFSSDKCLKAAVLNSLENGPENGIIIIIIIIIILTLSTKFPRVKYWRLSKKDHNGVYSVVKVLW